MPGSMVAVEAISSEGCLQVSSPLLPEPAPPKRPFNVPGEHLHLPGLQWSLLHHPHPWEPVPICLVGVPFSTPYDVVILLFQTMDLQSFQEGGPGFLVVLPSSTPFGSLITSPMGSEGGLTQLLHIAGRGLCPHEVCTVIQLFSFEDHFVAPPPRLDPLCIVIKVLKVVPVHLLKEIIQEDGVPQRVLLFYKIPPGSIPLHVSGDGSGEGFSFICSDVLRYGDVIQVCPVGILFPSLSSEICQVPRAKATQLNWESRGGSTERGECSASRSRLALSLLKSLSEMRLAPSSDLTLRVRSWSLFGLGRGSLTIGGEPSTTAYGSGLALQLL